MTEPTPDANPDTSPDAAAGSTPTPQPTATSAPATPAAAATTTVAAAAAPGSAAPWERATLEKLLLSNLAEQRSARRWRNGIRIAWLVLVVAAVFLLGGEHSGGGGTAATSVSAAHTAVVEIKGEIASDADANAEAVVQAMRNAFEDKNAKAVVLLINSPGGSPVQAGIINDAIRRLKALHQKPVYAVVEETCASAAYYIAVGADQIYVDKASIVGSIGVLMDGFGFTGLMDKLGIERRLLTAGDNKGLLDPFSPLDEKQRAFAQALLDQIHRQFIQVVKEGRGERLKITPDTFSGLFWTGQQAVEMGLADQLGDLHYVAREVVKAETIVDYTGKDNVAERLIKRFGASIGQGAAQTLKNSPALQ